jgi:hypothetical protein
VAGGDAFRSANTIVIPKQVGRILMRANNEGSAFAFDIAK